MSIVIVCNFLHPAVNIFFVQSLSMHIYIYIGFIHCSEPISLVVLYNCGATIPLFLHLCARSVVCVRACVCVCCSTYFCERCVSCACNNLWKWIVLLCNVVKKRNIDDFQELYAFCTRRCERKRAIVNVRITSDLVNGHYAFTEMKWESIARALNINLFGFRFGFTQHLVCLYPEFSATSLFVRDTFGQFFLSFFVWLFLLFLLCICFFFYFSCIERMHLLLKMVITHDLSQQFWTHAALWPSIIVTINSY